MLSQVNPELCQHNELTAFISIRDGVTGLLRVVSYKCDECKKTIPNKNLITKDDNYYLKLFKTQS
jgi:hypothetical protein